MRSRTRSAAEWRRPPVLWRLQARAPRRRDRRVSASRASPSMQTAPSDRTPVAVRESIGRPLEVTNRLVEQLGSLPLQEMARARDDERPDELGEDLLAALREVGPDDVVVRSVQDERRHRVAFEEAGRLAQRTCPDRALVVAEGRAQLLGVRERL